MAEVEGISEQDIETQLRSGANETALRDAFGSALYEELCRTAREIDDRPTTLERTRQKVFILPGIVGSKLSRPGRFLDDDIWIDIADLTLGGVKKLALSHPQSDEVFASGVLLSAYLLMKLGLKRRGFDAEFLPYDWRYAPADIGKTLHRKLAKDGVRGAAIVCHSMGGLVARSLAARDPDGKMIRTVVTVGTPNHGSYSPVQVFRLNHESLISLADLDQFHTPLEIVRDVLRHFPGLVQMMPDPDKRPGEHFFQPSGWPSGGSRPLKKVLDAALAGIGDLPDADDRFSQIIGVGQETIQNAKIKDGEFVYAMSDDGDGTVPRDLAENGDVPRYYFEGSHAWLCNQLPVIRAVADILETGKTDRLPTFAPVSRLESIARTRGDEDLRHAADAKVKAMGRRRQIDLMTGFVSDEFSADDTSLGAEDAASAAAPSPVARAVVYDETQVTRALQNWQGMKESRDQAEEKIAAKKPLQAEDPERLESYAKRQLKLVSQMSVRDEGMDQDALSAVLQEGRPLLEETATETTDARNLRLERVIGSAEEFLSVMFIKRARLVTRSIGRIVENRGGWRGFGTGFLVAPGVLMTNHHVLRNESDANAAAVQFNYEFDVDGREFAGHIFDLRPDRLFVADVDLDFALVAVEAQARDRTLLSEFGHLPMVKTIGKIRVGQNVNIVQHPQGERKQVVFRQSTLQPLPKEPDTVAHYSGDTKPGSSGSPVLSDLWEVVALHHAGVPATDEDGNWLRQDGQPFRNGDDPKTIKWVANEGIRTSRIVKKLQEIYDQPVRVPGHALIGDVLKVGEQAAKLGPFYVPRGVEDGTAEFLAPAGEPAPLPGAGGGVTREPVDTQSAPPAAHPQGAGASITLPLTISFSIGTTPLAAPAHIEVAGSAQLATAHGTAADTGDGAEDARSAADLADRIGYDRDFLGARVELPTPRPGLASEIATLLGSGETELKYDHFSVLHHRVRRMAALSAGNYRFDAPFTATRKDPWAFDPRLPRSLQIGNELYKHNELDRGHLFRRADGAWGETPAEARRASDDTFHWTNIVPQHEVFNGSQEDPNLSIWSLIENHLVREAQVEQRRLSIFNGPIFTDRDLDYRGAKIPGTYFKVAVIRRRDGELAAFAFVLGQQDLLRDLPSEAFDVGRFAVFQVGLPELEERTGLDFGALRRADSMKDPRAGERFVPGRAAVRIASLTDIVGE